MGEKNNTIYMLKYITKKETLSETKQLYYNNPSIVFINVNNDGIRTIQKQGLSTKEIDVLYNVGQIYTDSSKPNDHQTV